MTAHALHAGHCRARGHGRHGHTHARHDHGHGHHDHGFPNPFALLLMGGPRHRGRGFGPGGPGGPGGPFGMGGPFGAGGPFGPGGFGGRKRGRGDIRAAILALLAEGPMHGYQVMRELAERSEGAWRPSPGSVYPTLQQLEDEGLVRPEQADGGKRVFALTDSGRELAAQATGPKPWEAAAAESDDAAHGVRDLVFQVMAATRQVVHAGTPAQVEAAKAVLKGARRDLYRILAEDDEADPADA